MKMLRSVSGFSVDGPGFVRSVYAEALLEDFFVAAVTSVLAIRFYLRLTGYPRIGVGGLHITHVLLGGILMLVALIVLLAFLNRSAKQIAAVVGGVGFGAFIDELGKFITSDNDYFFVPTVALIYITFVLLFLSIRFVVRRQEPPRTECLLNAFEIAGQASIGGIKPHEAQLASKLLGRCGQREIVVQNLKSILEQMAPAPSPSLPLFVTLRQWLDRFYGSLTRKWWFNGAVVSFSAIVSITPMYALVAFIQWSWALSLWLGGGTMILAVLFWSRQANVRQRNVLAAAAIVIISILMTWAILLNLKQKPLSLFDWAQVVFPSVSGIIVVIGLLLFPLSRLQGYRMFRRAVLLSIFLTQVLAFYEYQLVALAGLAINIAILLALRYMITNEEAKLAST